MPPFKTITDEPIDFWKDKRVLLRLDANVPLSSDGRVADGYRLEQSWSTVEYLQAAGAKLIILAHLGSREPLSLAPVATYLKSKLDIQLVNSIEALKQVELASGEVVLLENLRFNSGEEKNDPAFVELLASLGEVYVNDAFSVSHREHASIVGLPKFLPAYAGLSFAREVKELSAAFEPERPFLVIIGGAKFGTKVPLVKKFLNLADRIIIGGALANNFYQARGEDVKGSLVDDDLELVKEFLNQPKIVLPESVTWADDKIVDAGPGTITQLTPLVAEAKMILWNGPLGNFENGYGQMTEELAKLLASSGARTIVGGGDTLAAIEKLNLLDKFSFVSAAGGAMLDFLATGTLPGLTALK